MRTVFRSIVAALTATATWTSAVVVESPASGQGPTSGAAQDRPPKGADATDGGAPPASSLHNNLYRKTLAGTCLVRTADGRGSGWLLDAERRLVITNHHVTAGALQAYVHFPQFKDGAAVASIDEYRDDDAHRGEVLLSDPTRDLAVIKLSAVPAEARGLALAPRSTQPGETTLSIGNPAFSQALWVLTIGTVRQVYRRKMTFESGQQVDAMIVETQSPTNPGDSGGPVVDERGLLVGVVSAGKDAARLMTAFIDVSEVVEFKKLIDELYDPQSAEQFAKRGEQYLERGHVEPALRDFAEALRLDPESPEALAGRGRCKLRQSKQDEALDDFNAAIRIDPANLAARLGRAEIGVERGLYEQVIAEMTELIRRRPESADFYARRGVIHAIKRDFAEAEADLKKAIEREPTDPRLPTALGRVFVDAGQTDRALETFAEAIKKFPYYLPVYLELGNLHLRVRKDLNAAASVFTEALKRNPQSAEALFGRGDAFMQDGQYDRAMTDLMAAIRLAPKMATAYSLRGDILLISGDNRAAIADYRKALELDPSRAQFHCDLGVALVRDEQFAEAAECLKRAARLNPQMTRALIYLAVAYFSEGNEEESNRTLARAVEIDPKLKGAKLKRYETKHLAIVNNTERTLELKIWYYTNAVGGEWRWYPEAPDEGPPAVHVLEPRATFSPAVKGVKLPVGKIRFTARDKSGDLLFTRFKDADLRTTADSGYVDAGYQTFTYMLSEK